MKTVRVKEERKKWRDRRDSRQKDRRDAKERREDKKERCREVRERDRQRERETYSIMGEEEATGRRRGGKRGKAKYLLDILNMHITVLR